MKKKITVSFSGFWAEYDLTNTDQNEDIIMKILRANYDVEVVEKNAQYVFCSMFNNFQYLNETGVRIFLIGEPYSPNWNYVDYAIGYDYMKYGDRFLQMANLFDYKSVNLCNKKHKIDKNILKDKTKFCCFMYSNGNDLTGRKEFFDELSKYKFVEAPSKVRHNCDTIVPRIFSEQINYLSKFKFIISFENFKFSGYHTEKMSNAMAAQAIPIYFGDPEICDNYNEKAFINVARLGIDGAIEKVKELDNNDELYLEMLSQPAYNDSKYVEKSYQALESFLKNIIDQPYETSFRRSTCTICNNECRELLKIKKKNAFLSKIKQFVKKILRIKK